MLQFTTRRLLLLIPVLLGVLLVTLIISRLVPGDPCIAMMGEKATQAQCAAFRERFGLNDNIGVQFVRYLGNLVQGDFGESIEYNRPVVEYLSLIHISEPTRLGMISYAVFCLKKKKT